LAEQSFGRWKVTDAIGEPVPRKAIVEIRADDEALTMSAENGSIVGTWPVGRIRFERYGEHDGYLDLVGQSAWITSVDKRPPDELAAFLYARWTPQAPATASDVAEDRATFTRTYAAPNPAEASRAFTADAEVLLKRGYRPASQFWVDPDRSTATALRVGAVLVGLVSLLFLPVPMVTILLLAFAAVLFIMGEAAVGKGSLNVTYERLGDAAAEPGDELVVDARRRLLGLAQLRDEGLITADEFEAKRAAIVDDL
jgi:hypothetical protein